MKTKKLSIAIALLAVSLIWTSFGKKKTKKFSDKKKKKNTSSAL